MSEDGLWKEVTTLRSALTTLSLLGVGTGLLYASSLVKLNQLSNVLNNLGAGIAAAAVINLVWDLWAKRAFARELTGLVRRQLPEAFNLWRKTAEFYAPHKACNLAFDTLVPKDRSDIELDIVAITSESWFYWVLNQPFSSKTHIRVLLLLDPTVDAESESDRPPPKVIQEGILRQWGRINAETNRPRVEVRRISTMGTFYFGIADGERVAYGLLRKPEGSWCWETSDAFSFLADSNQSRRLVEELGSWFEHHWKQAESLLTP